jgi:hypothetical protein
MKHLFIHDDILKKRLKENSTRKFYDEILRDLVLFFIFKLFYINLKDVLFFQ